MRVLREDVVLGPPTKFSATLANSVVESVGRRGKNIVFVLGPSLRLVVNLGMTGRLIYSERTSQEPDIAHPGVVFGLTDGATVIYDDIRRFGLLRCLTTVEYAEWSATIGPEPLARSFSTRKMAELLGKTASPVRSALLDQRRIAGVGNIYALEALWSAGVHPTQPANTIEPPAIGRLHRALRRILRQAIKARGTTFRDYRGADGEPGGFAPTLKVYGRKGENCARCNEKIARSLFGGRSAFFCPHCQPEADSTRPSTESSR